MTVNQCRHMRQTRVLETVRCTRPAVKDGYCTRHHPSYVAPKDRKAETALLSLQELSNDHH